MLAEAEHEVEQDLRTRNVEPTTIDEIPTPAKALVTLALTNTTDEDIEIPAGTFFRVDGAFAPAYALLETVTVEASSTLEDESTVAEAEGYGDVYNVFPGDITVSPVTGVTVTNNEEAGGGVNRPLQRLVTYKLMLLILYDVFRTENDAWDYKRKVLDKKYADELKALIASGVLVPKVPEIGATTMRGSLRLERS